MTGVFDSKTARASWFAERLVSGYVRGDSRVIDRVTAELTREDDMDLLMLVLQRTLQVSIGVLVMLAARVGANPARAIEDAFLTQAHH
jgi:hypothetical protein